MDFHKKPSVVYGYEDTLMAYKISKILNVVLVFVILTFIVIFTTLIQMKDREIFDLKQKIQSLEVSIYDKSKTILSYMQEINRLEGKMNELEAINNSANDIENYIQTYHKEVPPTVAKDIADALIAKTTEHNVPLVAAIAVTEVESKFNPYAVSSKGARGLMQVMPTVWSKQLDLESKFQLHDIVIGIDAGCRVLRKYLDDTNNNMKKALYKYVGGSDNYGRQVYESMGKFIVFRSFSQMTIEESLFSSTKTEKKVNNKSILHEIKKGETLGLIAKKYTGNEENWVKIKTANPGLIPEKLEVGQKILIPPELVKINKALEVLNNE